MAGDSLKIIVLDVGEGQAVLMVNDGKGMLIDTGMAKKGPLVIQKLNYFGVKQLDHIILTHLHPDHAGAVFFLKEEFPETTLYESGYRSLSKQEDVSYHQLVTSFDAKMYGSRHLQKNDVVIWQGVQVSVQWPPGDMQWAESGVKDTVNGRSLVLLIQYAGKKILIMGDAGSDVEAVLMQKDLVPTDVDILVVGHHGAKDGSSQEFLEKVKPVNAVISVNDQNYNGYPGVDVLERLGRYSKKVYMTSMSGDCIFEFFR